MVDDDCYCDWGSNNSSVVTSFGLQQCRTIDNGTRAYSIAKVLKDGPVRAVLLVRSLQDFNAMHVMKVERRFLNNEDTVIKKEAKILKLFMRNGNANPHFPLLIDRGKMEQYNFIVVELLGRNLADLKVSMPNKIFSVGTSVRLCAQCLEALSQMHERGIVHRDVKPSNFAMGVDQKSDLVFFLDFRLSRKFLDQRRQILAPRKRVGFKGALKFAPLNGHRRLELGPRDDIESLFYILLDFILPGGLPWEHARQQEEVRFQKEELRGQNASLEALPCGSELAVMLTYIDALYYDDRVDYSYLVCCLNAIAMACNANPRLPFDWELEDNMEYAPNAARRSFDSTSGPGTGRPVTVRRSSNRACALL